MAWVLNQQGSQLPYSPHFANHTPVCNGTIWRSGGNILLGHYLIHLARLLNWDEKLARGYGGFNPAAITWWREHLNRPLADVAYPVLSATEVHGIEQPSFRPLRGGFRKAG